MHHVKIKSQVLSVSYREHYHKWRSCRRCSIGCYRDKIALVSGRIPAHVLFIGEAPGMAEDVLGRPFVGPAGQLLNRWIDHSGMYPYAITNLVACRPTDCIGGDNRQPTPLEISHCHARLLELFYMVQPKLIVAVGRVAENNLLTREATAMQATIAAIKHPAYVLRCGGEDSNADKTERKRLQIIVERYL